MYLFIFVHQLEKKCSESDYNDIPDYFNDLNVSLSL